MPQAIDIVVPVRKQFRPYFQRKERWASIVAHRRLGKTVVCIQDAIRKAGECKRREPRISYVAPTFVQAKDVAMGYLKQFTHGIPGVKVSESELSVTLPSNGARIKLYGADNYDRMRGLYNDHVVLDEYGDFDPRAWAEVIRPSLSDRLGSATFIGTPKGRNAFYKIHQHAKNSPDWFSATFPASQTGIIAQSELDDARRTMTAEQYAAEYECSFDASLIGAYYAKEVQQAEDEKRLCHVPHDRNADVFAAWDLGISDNMAIWVGQICGKEIHWLRYYENNGYGLDHYVDYLRELPYRIDELILPHDAAARELQTGKSRVEYLEGRGFDCTVVPLHKIDDGINAVRMAFNRMWFDTTNAGDGLELCRQYQAEYDSKRDVLKRKPLHNFASHCADALRCGIMGMDEDPVTQYYDVEDQEWVV